MLSDIKSRVRPLSEQRDWQKTVSKIENNFDRSERKLQKIELS
jgi:hypothetical protein